VPDREGVIPSGFDRLMAGVLVPGEEDAAAAVLSLAVAGLDDAQLASFLEALATRIRDRAVPVKAAELQSLLDSCLPR
jgi:hypothetical protein